LGAETVRESGRRERVGQVLRGRRGLNQPLLGKRYRGRDGEKRGRLSFHLLRGTDRAYEGLYIRIGLL